jgi:hypothetical protein
MASPTHMSRLIARILANTWVESVRCRSLAFNHPRCFHLSSSVSGEQTLCVPFYQALAKFAEHACIKARISQFQPQQIFPVNATANGIGSLPVRQLFHELQDGNQSQAPRRLNRSAIVGKKRGLSPDPGREFLARRGSRIKRVSTGIGSTSNTNGFLGNGKLALSR